MEEGAAEDGAETEKEVAEEEEAEAEGAADNKEAATVNDEAEVEEEKVADLEGDTPQGAAKVAATEVVGTNISVLSQPPANNGCCSVPPVVL